MAETITDRIRRLPTLLQDAVLAVALAIAGCLSLGVTGGGGPHDVHGPGPGGGRGFGGQGPQGQGATPFGPFGSPSPWAYVVTIAAFLPLAWRRIVGNTAFVTRRTPKRLTSNSA